MALTKPFIETVLARIREDSEFRKVLFEEMNQAIQRGEINLDELKIPNELTDETLAKSERGEELNRAKNLSDLFRKLNL